MRGQNKKKSEIEEINKIFEKFIKHVENVDDIELDYEEVYRKNEMIRSFNKKVLECNNLCIKYPEINKFLYEEQKCLTNCQRKIMEVNTIVGKYFNELKAGKFNSPYLNPNIDL